MSKKAVLMSIKPEFVKRIMNGEKSREFRKKRLPDTVGIIMVYSSAPEKKIVGWFTNHLNTLSGTPLEVYNALDGAAIGISEREYFKYYADAPTAYAIHIASFNAFTEPITLESVDPLLKPAQSWRYLTDKQVAIIFENTRDKRPLGFSDRMQLEEMGLLQVKV